MTIDIGGAATDRATVTGAGDTIIAKDNPANASGKILSIEIWANTNLANCEVAIFEEVSANTFTTRDNEAIGSVTAGSKQTFAVNLLVEAGDYIGIYHTAGALEYDNTTGEGIWYVAGADHIPCTNQAFSFVSPRIMSLYGTGISSFPVTDGDLIGIGVIRKS